MPGLSSPMHSPFKFLDPYRREDGAIFFGRREEVETLYQYVNKNRLVLVYGQSGTGKTSVVQCGLANRFEATEWMPFFIRRGDDINASFYHTLSQSGALKDREVNAHNLHAALEELNNYYLRRVYLIFDHFEIGLPQKIDKVNTGYKKDGDTRGFRKYLASFHYNYHNQAPVSRLLIDLKHVFEHAEHHAGRLTLDDLNTLDKVLPKLERRIDGQDIGHTVELTQLGDRLRALKETYYNFVQEKLAALK